MYQLLIRNVRLCMYAYRYKNKSEFKTVLIKSKTEVTEAGESFWKVANLFLRVIAGLDMFKLSHAYLNLIAWIMVQSSRNRRLANYRRNGIYISKAAHIQILWINETANRLFEIKLNSKSLVVGVYKLYIYYWSRKVVSARSIYVKKVYMADRI
jgi:hypothetical protein